MPSFIVLPFILAAGDEARAEEVMANYQAILDVVNGGLGDLHFASDAELDGAKLKEFSVATDAIGLGAVTGSRIGNSVVTSSHTSNDSLSGGGFGVNKSDLVSNHLILGGAAPSAKAQGGFTTWGWIALTDNTAHQFAVLDQSVDWRQRIVKITTLAFSTGTSAILLPGGANDKLAESVLFRSLTDVEGTINIGMGFLEGGSAPAGAPVAAPRVRIDINLQTPGENIHADFFALSGGNGDLAMQTGTDVTSPTVFIDMYYHIEASPMLGVP